MIRFNHFYLLLTAINHLIFEILKMKKIDQISLFYQRFSQIWFSQMFYQSMLNLIFDFDQKKSFDFCVTLCIQDHYIDNAQSWMKLKMCHSNIKCNFVSKFEWMNFKHLNVNIQTIYLRCSLYLYKEHLFMLTIISW
jgi:hypothetical protein